MPLKPMDAKTRAQGSLYKNYIIMPHKELLLCNEAARIDI